MNKENEDKKNVVNVSADMEFDSVFGEHDLN